MKKILLATTAIIGAASFAGAALAEDPKVTVGGFSDFQAAYVKSNYDAHQNTRSFRNDNEIHFNVAGKAESGLGYGAEIDLQADINGSNGASGTSNNGTTARRTFAFLTGDAWGRAEMGSNDSAASTLKVDAGSIARAAGGINGNYNLFAQTNVVGSNSASNFSGSRKYITSPNLPVENGPASAWASDLWANNTKITYYTPRFAGLQLGVSYAPSLTARGQATNRIENASGEANDVLSGGINYQNEFNQIGVAAAVTGERAKTATGVNGQNIEAYNAGAKVSYLGWSVAGSYGDWSDSLAAKDTKAQYWTGGLAYETGPVGASLTYLGSETKPTGQNNKFSDVSFGVDYKLAPGLTPFAEYNYFVIDPSGGSAASGNVSKSTGSVVIIGSQLTF